MDESGKINEDDEIKNILNNFTNAYAERDKSIVFSKWLAERIKQEIPEMSEDVSKKLSNDIIGAVAAYDQTLDELNRAVEEGQSKEEWLAERMVEAVADIPSNEAGNILQKIDNDYTVSNALLMKELDEKSQETVTAIEGEVVDWNEYSIKDKALNIGKQAVMSSLGAAAGIVKRSMENEECPDVSDVIGQAMQEGIEIASNEVKAVVAGAIKTSVEKRLLNILPQDTPVETITNMACLAVESASTLSDVVSGKKTTIEALEEIGRAGVAAACNIGADIVKGSIGKIPVIGPVAVQFAGGLIDHMKSHKFSNDVYTVVRDTAVATWNGIKQTSKTMLNSLKNTVKSLLFG